MPSTYLLLRNNKQTGPHSLEALLQYNLQPQDLIWEEGRSAGWKYPHEVTTLKPYIPLQKSNEPENRPVRVQEERNQPAAVTRPALAMAAHIYVALPAGVSPRATEEPPAPNLEAKAEALYQRIQAYTSGQTTDDADTRYARSLDDMKQEYGAWLVKQNRKKKTNISRKKLIFAASVLIVTTTGFGLVKWMQNKPVEKEPAFAGYASGIVVPAEKSQTTAVSFHPATDTFTTTLSKTALQNNSVSTNPIPEKSTKKTASVFKPKQPMTLTAASVSVYDTTATAIASVLPPEKKSPVQPALKKMVPLSQSVFVSGTLPDEKNSNATTRITLRNTSNETLKIVAVAVTYFKKEDRRLNKETVYFYNVLPAATLSTTASGNRRATSARFEIGTITRADGSLYLIH